MIPQQHRTNERGQSRIQTFGWWGHIVWRIQTFWLEAGGKFNNNFSLYLTFPFPPSLRPSFPPTLFSRVFFSRLLFFFLFLRHYFVPCIRNCMSADLLQTDIL